MLGELLAAGFVSTVLGGIQEKAELNRKMKDAGIKAQQWIAEREAVEQAHRERMNKILERYAKEDQEREARRQQAEQQADQEQEARQERTTSGTITIDNISFSTSSNTADSADFEKIFKDFEKNFE